MLFNFINSKIVLRSVLPIINAELHRLLDDVVGFDVEVKINDKNDVEFSCSTSYTLERGGEFGFDIIVSVIDEEERALDDMCSQMEAQ